MSKHCYKPRTCEWDSIWPGADDRAHTDKISTTQRCGISVLRCNMRTGSVRAHQCMPLCKEGISKQNVPGVTVVISSPNPNQLRGGKSGLAVPSSKCVMSLPFEITCQGPDTALDRLGMLGLLPRLQRPLLALRAGTHVAGLMCMTTSYVHQMLKILQECYSI